MPPAGSPPPDSPPSGRAVAAGLFALALLPLLLRLGWDSLYDWDEAWYGQVARELLRSGDWLALTWRGVPFTDKTPLGIWAIAASFATFGFGEWQARLPSALASALTVPVLFAIGREVFGSTRPALIAGLVL